MKAEEEKHINEEEAHLRFEKQHKKEIDDNLEKATANYVKRTHKNP